MLTPQQRLIKYGFYQSEFKNIYHDKKDFDWSSIKKEDAEKHADEERSEIANISNAGKFHPLTRTGYPKPEKKYRLIFESFGMSIEESYFWVLEHLRQDQAFPKIIKIKDIFSASENSAFWGQSSQRLGIQQDKVQTLFATIGKMIKDLFQLVREIRIIEERLEIYKQAPKTKSADVTLKGIYIDLVEGGTEKPTSVYGMAKQVGFTILPDLFFNFQCYDLSKLDQKIEELPYNPSVKNVLKRKMFSYINWKEKTEIELNNRFIFNLKYLRQHWGIIKMYAGWVKPYIRNIKRLSMSEDHFNDPELISAFETSIIELEFLAKRDDPKGDYHPVIISSFKLTTKPIMSYQQEYQRGPVHVGRMEMNLRAYAWNDKQIENYKKMRDEEDMELLGIIDQSIQAAMDALKDDLNRYLEKAGELIPKEKKTEEKKESFFQGSLEPIGGLIDGFKILFGSLVPKELGNVFTNNKGKEKKDNKKSASSDAKTALWLVYKNYKKSHKLLAW
ncbi:MAG: hypothetical protein QXG00_06015 [Candidatus Woesearchaeota archaeon]